VAEADGRPAVSTLGRLRPNHGLPGSNPPCLDLIGPERGLSVAGAPFPLSLKLMPPRKLALPPNWADS